MFTQGAGAFSGLNATDLAVRPKDYRRLVALRSVRGAAPSKRPKRRDGTPQGNMSMSKSHAEMVERLRQSVAEIVGSDAADKEDLLKKSFDEFQTDLESSAEAAQEGDFDGDFDSDFEGEEVEFDPVVSFSDSLAHADEIAAILAENGEIDEDTAALLGQWSALSDIAIRSLANTRAIPVYDEAEMEAAKADGLGLMEMSLAKADGSEADETMLVKTDLPAHVAQFITDPDQLAAMIADAGFEFAEVTGVGEALSKMDPNMDPGMAAGPAMDPGALAEQVQVMMRLNAAALVQGEAVMRAMGGDMGAPEDQEPVEQEAAEGDFGDEGEEGEEGYEAADEGAEEEHEEPDGDEEGEEPSDDDGDEPARKPPFRKSQDAEELTKSLAGELNKMMADTLEPLRKQLETANAEIARLKAAPAPAKGVLNTAALSKAEDVSGQASEDPMAKIAALPESQRATELMKLVHRNPIPVTR